MSAMMLIIQVMVYFPNTTCRRKRGRFIFWQTPDTENTFNHHKSPGEGMFLYPNMHIICFDPKPCWISVWWTAWYCSQDSIFLLAKKPWLGTTISPTKRDV
jgi:hypothetical protein